MKHFILILLFFGTLGRASAEAPVGLSACEGMAISRPFLALLSRLLDEGKWGAPADVERLLSALEREVPGALFEDNASTERLMINQLILRHWPVSQERELVMAQLRERLKTSEAARSNRASVVLETVDAIQKTPLRFVRIEGGSFRVPEVFFNRKRTQTEVKVTLPYDFEVMDVPVTQDMWVRHMGGLMDLGNSFHGNIIKLADVELDDAILAGGDQIQIATGVPATNLTVHSMAQFANLLSESQGLRPAYELDNLRGSAAFGDLMARDLSPSDGRVRDVEGFRLPTEAEWAVLALNAHRHLNTLSFDQQRDQLLNWGRFRIEGLVRVGTRTPLEFNGGRLYDLLGLVKERVHQVYRLEDGRDGLFPPGGGKELKFVNRGGAVTENPLKLDPSNTTILERADISVATAPGHAARWNLGFRLVRTLPLTKPAAD